MEFEFVNGMPVEIGTLYDEYGNGSEEYPHATEQVAETSGFVDLCTIPESEWQYW